MLADAIEKRILHFVHGSMRIRVDLRPGGVNEDLAFWGLLMIWEIGYLPAGNLASFRFVDAAVASLARGRGLAGGLPGERLAAEASVRRLRQQHRRRHRSAPARLEYAGTGVRSVGCTTGAGAAWTAWAATWSGRQTSDGGWERIRSITDGGWGLL